MSRRAYIIYGYIEGPGLGKRMRRALYAHGIKQAKSVAKADIIIAHSGGCFDIPQLRDDQLLMLIDPPYWPGRSLVTRGRKMLGYMFSVLRPSKHLMYQLRKNLYYVLYFIKNRKRNRRIWARADSYDLAGEVLHTNTILVRNDDDPWITADLGAIQAQNPQLQIAHLPGGHDHCWDHPNAYVKLINEYRLT